MRDGPLNRLLEGERCDDTRAVIGGPRTSELDEVIGEEFRDVLA